MFSPATIASSTTMPSAMMNANIEIMLIEMSNMGRNSIAPRNEVGMPTVTQNASRSSRKSPSTTSTMQRPRNPLRRSSSRRCR
jgi:hypothetical protein